MAALPTDVRPGTPDADRPARRRLPADLAWGLPGALLGLLLVLAAHRGLIDDAYITLDYARNVATDLHWGLIPTEESNAATSPLNVLLLALGTALVRLVTGEVRPVAGFGVLSVAACAALAVWAAQTARRVGVSPAWSLAALAVVLANPFVSSSVGLEVLPVAALLTGLLAQAVRGARVGAGLLTGLLVLTRLDLAVVAAVVLLCTPALRRRPWVTLAVAAGTAGPWYVFSWFHFGSAIPSTFAIKTLQRSFGDQTFANGLWTLWGPRGALPLWVALVPALLGLVTVVALLASGVRRRLPAHLWPLAGLGLGGVAYHLAYALLGVPPYQWYYAPSTVALGVTGVLGLALLLRQQVPAGRRQGAVALGTALVVAALAFLTLDGRSLPWTHPVYFGNWAEPAQYRDIGAEVGRLVGPDTVIAPPEIGTLAFGCDCSMVDAFSDPGRTLELIDQRIDRSGPVGRFLLSVNFAHLDRDQQPRPAQYRLVWTQGEVPAGVPSWPTTSPATGPATLYLDRVG
jgi:hypothetical protein